MDGADEIWMAVIGPDTPARGEVRTEQRLFQNQVAATAAALLGLDYSGEFEAGTLISEFFGQ
jgi:hypothetical protein